MGTILVDVSSMVNYSTIVLLQRCEYITYINMQKEYEHVSSQQVILVCEVGKELSDYTVPLLKGEHISECN